MGLFIEVKTLAGTAIVCGQVRSCVFDKGTLSIEGLTLVEAMGLMSLLASDTITTAKLSGVLPVATPQVSSHAPDGTHAGQPQVMHSSPQAAAAQAAGWRDAGPDTAPNRPMQAPATPVQGAVLRTEVGTPNAPEADPFVAPAAPVAPAATDNDDLPPPAVVADPFANPPDDVLRSQTLRLPVGWLHEKGVDPTVNAMLPKLRELIAKMPPGPLTKGLTDDELTTRIKSTLERMDLLK